MTFSDLVFDVIFILNLIVPLIIGIALLGFFWGIFLYAFKTDDETARGNAKEIMWWGIIALFVMISVFGILQILLNTFSLDSSGVIFFP